MRPAAAGLPAIHRNSRFIWVATADGATYDIAVTTMHHGRALHSGTHPGIDAPIHGFVLNGRLYLDPAGVFCETAADSSLTQTSASTAFFTEYSESGLLPAAPLAGPRASNCIVSGRVILGVAPAAAATLSSFLLRKATTRFVGLSHIVPGREGGLRGLGRTEAQRELAKTPVVQSAGTRTMLFARFVWSDQGPADVSMSDATFLARTKSFVAFANNCSYGNMIIVPTYMSGCVYALPGHTYAQVGAGLQTAAPASC